MGEIDKALAIEGWMSEEELTWLAEKASQSLCIVEIGSYRGRSSRALADNLPEGGIVHCVDSYQPFESALIGSGDEGDTIHSSFLSNLSDHIEAKRVILHRLNSLHAAHNLFRSKGKKIDFLFIDGNHDYFSVRMDIFCWTSLVKPGGVISGHDYNIYPGVTQAVKEVFGSHIENPVGSIWCVQL